MALKASNVSAALTGAWSALGFVFFEAWMAHHRANSALPYNLLALLAGLIFLFVPGFFFVIGRNTGAFSRWWFTDPTERMHYAIVVRRMFIWFVSAGVVNMLFASAIDSLFQVP